MLYTTNIANNQTDLEYQEFIKICNDVLPLKIETPYIDLANLIEEYLKKLSFMYQNDSNAMKMGIESGNVNNTINPKIEVQNDISRKIREISQKDSYTSDDYQELIRLAQKGKELALAIERGKSIIDQNQDKTIFLNKSSGEIQNSILDVVLKIQNTLKSISKLDIDGNKRLDNLEVTEKHINQISNLNMDIKDKKHAYDLINAFLKTRKNAFQTVEEFGYHILEKYKKREINLSDELFFKYDLSSLALEGLELGDGMFGKGNFIFNDFKSKALLTTSKIYNAYMNGEEISQEDFDESREILKDYTCTNLIDKIEDDLKYQIRSEFKM